VGAKENKKRKKERREDGRIKKEKKRGEGVAKGNKKRKKEGRGYCLGQAYGHPDEGVGCCRIEQ
jgi:hypothetical protein